MNNSMLPQSSSSTLWITTSINELAIQGYRAKQVLHSTASPFQKIEVFETYTLGKVLILAGSLVVTERDEFIYNEMISHLPLLAHGAAQSVCIIGGGDGGALREVLKHEGVKKVVVVDIDELVVDTVREYFPDLCRGFEDSRTHLVIDDGANYLQNTTERFDVIIVDAFDPGGPIQSLSTQPFYEQLHAHLSDEGIVVIQTDSPTTNPEPLRQTLSAVSSLFESYRPYLCSMPTLPEGMCSFCICSKRAQDFSIRAVDKAIAIEEHCSYYNRQIHEASFALPRYVRELVSA